MAALTEGRNTIEISNGGKTVYFPVAAGVKIFEGAFVALENGYARPAVKTQNITAAGRAEAYVDNSGGSAGAVMIKVRRGIFIWDNGTSNTAKVKPEHLLQPCYFADDHSVTATETGSSIAGKVIAIFDDGVAVETL